MMVKKFNFVALDCYLVLILNERTIKINENIYHVHIDVNINRNMEMFEWKSLLTFEKRVYQVEELIEKVIELLMKLPDEIFKSIDTELTQRKLVKDKTDHYLSDVECLNKEIQQVYLLLNANLNTKPNSWVYLKPQICPNCYQDIDDFTAMTTLKICGHWLCDNCWKQYQENAVESVKLIACPEWNCVSVVDAGK